MARWAAPGYLCGGLRQRRTAKPKAMFVAAADLSMLLSTGSATVNNPMVCGALGRVLYSMLRVSSAAQRTHSADDKHFGVTLTARR